MTTKTMNDADIWKILELVKDPEIPVVSVVDMGIVRDVSLGEEGCTVTITPTYSGCPAMEMIGKEIETTLAANGAPAVEVKTVLSPAWTTDWMTDDAKERLRVYGIAPPKKVCASTTSPFESPNMHTDCPYCKSGHTELRSQFGSTACKALHYCHACHQPYESFKCI